ncbi:general odorant-binding protein 56d [Drosophila virilis]|uniref:Odorant-binding protein 56eL1 n=1 Tax=Drosophila virilis TaxID=7244 RepID=B4LPY5_DROVI|nr:general odorant-binding protein 56d [Drosophila virilis]EDW60308.1 Odorant-binding protein 56eL1 [Drosophila virilis]
MKFMIALLGLVTMALAADITEEHRAIIRQHANECTQQEGNTKAQAMALRNGNFDDTDERIKCFANCFLEKAGFIVDGQLMPAVVQQKLTDVAGASQVKAALNACDSIKGANKCDTGFQIYQCFYKNRAFP